MQIEESLWWFVKLAKLKIKLIAPRSDQEALSPRGIYLLIISLYCKIYFTNALSL